jgi:hypothetical protein
MKKKTMLSKFYEENRTTPQGRVFERHDQLFDGMLNRLQRMGVVHGLDLHAATPAWRSIWIHVEDKDGNMISAHKSPDHETVRADLPPIAIQWKQSYGHGGNKHG